MQNRYNFCDKKAHYFKGLVDFSFFGVNGSGGRASIARSKWSVRSCASDSGSKSSFSSSACCASAEVGLRFMVGV